MINKNLNKTIWYYLSLAVLLIIVTSSCAAKEQVKQKDFFDKWKARAEDSRAYVPAQADVDFDVLEKKQEKEEMRQTDVEIQPVPEIGLKEERKLPTHKITMTMRNTDANVLLRALAKTAGLNIMMTDKVKGVISVDVSETPWDQVFLGILRTRGLSYLWEGDIIRVMAVDDINQDVRLMTLNQELITKRKEHALKMSALDSKAQLVEPLMTWIYHIKYADAETLRNNLEEFLSAAYARGETEGQTDGEEAGRESRSSVLVDSHTNSLIIQAIKSDIERLKAIIKELDRPTSQVLVEAHIVETTKDMARDLGIEWGGLYSGTAGTNNYWVTPGSTLSGAGTEGVPSSGMAASFPAPIGDTGLSLGFVYEKAGEYLLETRLSALESEGKLNILSSPSITTLDNQTATIESGREVPFQTVEDDEVSIEWREAVLKLEVTPYVIDDRTIKLDIITNKDEVDFSSAAQIQGNPTIITKQAETTVLLLDGQTTVIGGLSKESKSDSEAGIPLLMKIPGLSYLFKNESTKYEMEEVLIFITPYILKHRGPVASQNNMEGDKHDKEEGSGKE